MTYGKKQKKRELKRLSMLPSSALTNSTAESQ